MRIENEDERKFYEIESAKSSWGIRILQRQYNSNLYERLTLSGDKDEVMRLAKDIYLRQDRSGLYLTKIATMWILCSIIDFCDAMCW